MDLYMDLNGFIRIYMDLYRSIWICIWTCIYSLDLKWIRPSGHQTWLFLIPEVSMEVYSWEPIIERNGGFSGARFDYWRVIDILTIAILE